MKNRFALLVLGMVGLISAVAHADDPQYGSAAPGELRCQLTYLLFDPSAAPRPAPSCPTCTMADPQHSMITPETFKLTGKFSYLYGGAKQSGVEGSDDLLSFRGSAQINADGYNNGMLIIYQGDKLLLHVMGGIVGNDLQVQMPGQGLKYQGKIVEQINASCFVKQ